MAIAPPLVAPQPRRACPPALDLLSACQPHPALLSPIKLKDDVFFCMPSPRLEPRLLAPFHLPEPFPGRKLSASVPKSCTPTPQPSRRRRKAAPRRRTKPAPPFAISRAPASLDELPWVALLDMPTTAPRWDLADLSALPVRGAAAPQTAPPTGPGPVRTRRASLRASPLAPAAELTPRSPRTSPRVVPTLVLPPAEPVFFDAPPVDLPRTPVRSEVLDFAHVRFFDLMPVLPGALAPAAGDA